MLTIARVASARERRPRGPGALLLLRASQRRGRRGGRAVHALPIADALALLRTTPARRRCAHQRPGRPSAARPDGHPRPAARDRMGRRDHPVPRHRCRARRPERHALPTARSRFASRCVRAGGRRDPRSRRERPFVRAAVAVGHIGFAAAGTSIGPQSEAERDALLRGRTLTAQVDADRAVAARRPRRPRRRGRQPRRRGRLRAGIATGRCGRGRRRGNVAGRASPRHRRCGDRTTRVCRAGCRCKDRLSVGRLGGGREGLPHVGFTDIGTACIASGRSLPD